MDYDWTWFRPGVRVLGLGLGDASGRLIRAEADNATVEEEAARVRASRTTLVLEVIIVLMSNILVIVIVAATKTFHSVASVLIINLAISDLLVGIGVMPFVAVSIINHSWVNSSDLCLYVGYTSSVYCTASVLTLAAIALDRYFSIMDCLRYSARCTLCRICAVVLWIWLQALATSCPPLLGWSAVGYMAPMFSCAVNWADSPSYTSVMVALSFLLPAGVILFCYVNIVRVARGHARRIHTLEDTCSDVAIGAPLPPPPPPRPHPLLSSSSTQHHHQRHQHAPSMLVYHLSGNFVTDVRGGAGEPGTSSPPARPAPPSSRRLLSRLVQTPTQQQQQHALPLPQQNQHHQHGVVRLFLATEKALRGKSSLVPPTAVTFSYWLVLLNSDINPLLYALLSKRFQGALHNLRQKLRARLGGAVGRGGEARAEAEDRCCDPCSSSSTTTTTHHDHHHQHTLAEGLPVRKLTSRYCSSVFTVNADFKHHQAQQQREVFLPGIASTTSTSTSSTSSSSLWQQESAAGGERKVGNCLQVPSRTQEGSRLPFSAVTAETRATFFYGQITVTVEHDVC
ncbi:hypothetical protein CRUP_013278 [Coryphaenoides rupestris]|nr:hypothetical protein CRUP_013278 [Coryphaenoides rupestris]